MHNKSFSPKEVADAIGVSESSIKRWSDAGLIRLVRTVGGHRRIGLGEALRFIRKQGLRVVRPDVLGFPGLQGLFPETDEEARETLFHLLKEGRRIETRRFITAAYLNGTGLAQLFDGLLSVALDRIGERWHDSDRGIFEEHVATSICIEALHEIRLLIPLPPEGAPVALGGAPERDPYLLPSLMVTALLADAGYETINLGPQTPPTAFHHAVATHRPSLVWIAITSPLIEQERNVLIQTLATPLQEQDVDVVVGGRSAQHSQNGWPAFIHRMGSMEDLAAFTQQHHQQAG